MQTLSAFFSCHASTSGNSRVPVSSFRYRGGADSIAGCSVSDTDSALSEDGLRKHDSDFRAKLQILG
jgi:hypothetical protein